MSHITIEFTECDRSFVQDDSSKYAAGLPVTPRVSYYEWLLANCGVATFRTLDEHMLLVAQWLRRAGRLESLTFVSHCGCKPGVAPIYIEIDNWGDFTDDPHHPLFTQRLKYLR